jgi:hypothetical protein
MMMDCPRCGFNQPKDRFCANCGLDIEQYNPKPKALWLRTLQNSNLHLGLIAVLIVAAAGYIFYSRSALVGQEVEELLRGTPLSSKDSSDAEEAAAAEAEALNVQPTGFSAQDDAASLATAGSGEDAETPEPVDSTLPEDGVAKAAAAGADGLGVGAAPEVQKMEITAYEISREALAAMILEAEKQGEGNEGRAYLWTQGAKTSETLKTSARMISLSRTMPLQPDAQVVIESPAGPNDAFLFALQTQITKIAGKEYTVKWQSNMVLPLPDNGASNTTMTGSVTMTPTSALLLVIEPNARTIPEEVLARSGEGPWSIFTSQNFVAGETEWVILVQPR